MDPKRSVEKIQDCEAAATRLRGAGPTGEYRARLKRLAELYIAADGYEPAIGYLDELIAKRDELGLRCRELAMLMVKKAEALRNNGRTPEAMDCCREAEELLGNSKRGYVYARLKMTRASVHTDLGDYAEALCCCKEALPLLKHGTRQRDLAELECGLGRIKARTGDMLGAREHFERSLCLFKEAEDKIGEGKAYNNLGVIHKTLCQWDRAVECFTRALESARKHGEARSVALRSCNLGVALLKAGYWRQARAYLADALKRSAGLGNKPGVIRASIALGILLCRERRWKASERHLRRALELAVEAGMKREQALALEFLGELAFDSGCSKEAVAYYEKALEIASCAVRHADVRVEVLRRKAEALVELGQAEEALEVCDEAVYLAQAIPDRYESAILERVAGLALLAGGKTDRAVTRLKRSHTMLRHIGQDYELARTALALGSVLAQMQGEGTATAKELFLEARYLFGQVGSGYWVRRAESALLDLLGMKGTGSRKARDRRVCADTHDGEALLPGDFGFVGCGRWLEEVMGAVRCFADSKLPVLIEGESGTGKDMVARALHLASGRKSRPYIPINCGALPDGTQESELYGYVRGAFTGAVSDRRGCFEAADGGTLLLDEIGEMNWSTQVRLLRVLEAGEVRRLGESFPRRVDVRIVAATNGDLLRAVGQGVFRKDLYYRLAGVRLHLPALRQRREDIALLVGHFVGIFARAQCKEVVIDESLMMALVEYHWPGNVRQLRNEIERMITLAGDRSLLTVNDFSRTEEPEDLNGDGPSTLTEELESLEKKRIIEALRQSGWNKARAAGALGGMKRTTLLGRMKKLGIPTSPPARLWPE
jgi:DNA-binding NtrC family response regulator/tetratricopeptide (TPR) repeat protein